MKFSFKNQNGAAAVEFAILLPVLVLLLFGIIEFGLLLYNQQVLTNASREGARAAIRGNCVERLNSEQIGDIVTNYCNGRLITFGESAPIAPIVAPEPSACTPGGSGPGVGDNVSVTAQYTYTYLAPSILGYGATGLLSATTVMKMESEP
jgi:hypothetical protein